MWAVNHVVLISPKKLNYWHVKLVKHALLYFGGTNIVSLFMTDFIIVFTS